MNPASTMKLVTTFAGARAARSRLPLEDRSLCRRTDRRRRVERRSGAQRPRRSENHPRAVWRAGRRAFAPAACRPFAAIWCSDRTLVRCRSVRSRRFDAEPLRPYNVGPDALAGQLQDACACVFAPNLRATRSTVRIEPPLANIGSTRRRASLPATVAIGTAGSRRSSPTAPSARRRRFRGATRLPAASATGTWRCSIITHYVLSLFARSWADVGGSFAGTVRDGRTRDLGDRASPRSIRCRSTRRCATSTSCRIT